METPFCFVSAYVRQLPDMDRSDSKKSCNPEVWGELFSPNLVGVISDKQLTEIEKEIKNILTRNNVKLIDREFASLPLPEEVVDSLIGENHNIGNQYFHGLFQKTD